MAAAAGRGPCHGAFAHPQTQGKVERFHGTIAAEVFAQRRCTDRSDAQDRCDAFRTGYNLERPHGILPHAVPASRYHPSLRPLPETVPPVAYGAGDIVRTVSVRGTISWQRRSRFSSRGLFGEPVAIGPTLEEDIWEVVNCHRRITTIDLTDPDEV